MDLNILATIKRITWINMLGSIPHQKFCFYHLPTRGRAVNIGITAAAATTKKIQFRDDTCLSQYVAFFVIRVNP